MKPIFLLILLFACNLAFAQEKEFHIQGKIIDGDSNPLGDVYILNYRNLDKAVSRQNGIFDMWVFPGDSLMISHVSYPKKVVRVFDLMVNPVVQIRQDTINIMEVDIFSDPQDDSENARENVESIDWDLRSAPR